MLRSPQTAQSRRCRSLGAYTADLYHLADWLTDCEIETVAMESTGVYWIPLFGVLEDRGFEVMLVDPRRIKNVPGRKSDVLDCQWLQQLHTYGLLSAAFRPEAEIRCAAELPGGSGPCWWSYASQHVQHMQKALTQMNVKLQHVIRDITGKTGMDIIEAIVRGERSPAGWHSCADPRIKSDEKTIAKSLRGHWRQEHISELTQALELYRTYQDKDRPVRPVRLKPSWSGLKTAATVSLRLPMARSAIRRTHPVSMSQGQLYRMTASGPDPHRRRGRIHGIEGDQRESAPT